jgi:2-isopropylmalate synthase
MRLVDYKVRVITSSLSGTASRVRVLIFSTDGETEWGTVGVSANIVEESWRALLDSVEYKLTCNGVRPIPCTQDDSLRDKNEELKEAVR